MRIDIDPFTFFVCTLASLVVLFFVSLPFYGVNTSPGDGEKIGQIVKINRVGIFRKTWEAELIRGGMNGGSGSFGVQPFDFTIESDSDAKAIQELMRNQTEITITYRIEGFYSSFRSDSHGAFLLSIKPVKTQ